MRTRAAAVFIVSFAIFLSNGRPHPEVDCVAAPFVAWSLAYVPGLWTLMRR